MSVLATRIDGVPGAAWPADDRALAYGDGLFETIAVHAAEPRLLRYHRERLESGCAALGLPRPPEEFWREVRELAATPGCSAVKALWSRGSGRGYRPPQDACGRRLLMALSAPTHSPERIREGVKVRLCRTRLSLQPRLAGLKHLARLENVLARAEWRDPGIAEGLMMNAGGALVEGTQSNLFLVRDGCLLTPLLDRCGVAGVVRRLVLEELAPEAGIETHCRRLYLADLLASEEVFLSNSLIGLWPVVAVDCWRRPVGPVTRRLAALWEQRREAGC